MTDTQDERLQRSLCYRSRKRKSPDDIEVRQSRHQHDTGDHQRDQAVVDLAPRVDHGGSDYATDSSGQQSGSFEAHRGHRRIMPGVAPSCERKLAIDQRPTIVIAGSPGRLCTPRRGGR